MRLRRAFRPSISGFLEHRVMPSLAAAPPPVVVLGHAVSLPSQMAGNPQVQAAIAAFTNSYAQAVDNVLLAPGPNGAVDPPANRPAFDAAIRQALDVLANDLVGALGNVSPGSPIVAQVVDDIIGDGPQSLESELLALSTASIVQAASAGTLTTSFLPAVSPAYARAAGQDAAIDLTPVPQTAASVLAAPTVTVAAPTALNLSSSAASAIQTAFADFLNRYYQAVRDVLMAPTTTGTIAPAANRPAFDARVNAALQALANAVNDALDSSDAESALATKFVDGITGDGTDSLAIRLAALPTPAGPDAALVRAFTLGSFRAAMQTFALVTGDLRQLASPAAAAP